MIETKKKIERVKGMRDVLPDDFENRKKALEIIRRVYEVYGYRGIEVPILEDIELHLRKSGEAIRKHMYAFRDHGMNMLCLRPELTASVVRMFTAELYNEPRPQKLYYNGSSFRYDKPQKGRYREFTQSGVERIGGEGAEHDAEIIALAISVMEALGIENYEVVIGNIGIALALLSQKKIEDRAKSYIIESLEELSKTPEKKKGIANVTAGLKKIGVIIEDSVESNNNGKELHEAVKRLPEDQAKNVIAWVIETIYGKTGDRRDSSEIAQNLLAKLERDKQKTLIQEALEFINKLIQISGHPPGVFDRAYSLLKDYDLDPKPINDLKEIVEYLECYSVDWTKVKIDFGFGRGLEYYTGMIFEIYCYSDELGLNQKQVCGGGRYDTLISDLGAPDRIPALGFSFGLERLVIAMPKSTTPLSVLDVFVATMGGEAEYKYGLEITSKLRKANIKADIGPRGANFRELTGMAKRLNAGFVFYLGDEELQNRSVTLRNMKTKKQAKFPSDEALDKMRKEFEQNV